MAKKESTLGQLELEVLKIVWERQGCTVPQAASVLARQKGYARTTILTVMQRLHKKGFVSREKKDGVFHYFPTEQKHTVLGNLARRFVDTIFEGSSASLVQHLAESDVSAEELTQIRDIIDKAMAAESEQTP